VVTAPDTAEANTFMALLREVTKNFSTRNLVEEFSACQCFTIREGWAISSWAPEEKWIEGIPMPDFIECFGLHREGTLFFLLSSPLISDVDPKAIEIAADEFVGPVGNVEYKQLVEKLGGTRRNRVFSFFGRR
jgi:hypothetical protein